LLVFQQHFSCSATLKEWRISQGEKQMFVLSRLEAITAILIAFAAPFIALTMGC
jgi:hypothetical protein